MGITRTSNYKKNHFLQNLFFYSSAALVCSLLGFSPIWIPFFSSSIEYFLSPKSAFIVGNLIVFLLVSSSPPPVNHDHLEKRREEGFFRESLHRRSYNDGDEEQEVKYEGEFLKSETDEDLNRRVDEYIAKVNRLRRIEAKLLQ